MADTPRGEKGNGKEGGTRSRAPGREERDGQEAPGGGGGGGVSGKQHQG